ncbi:MAG: dihydropteroate synthase, partial [Oliverpabstia sp.]
AKYGAACCLMHNRHEAVYENFLEDMVRDMEDCVRIAREAGVADDRIILDPGVGFGKTYEMNLEAIHHVDVLHRLGFPILLGTSRKSVIGLTLDLPADQRVEGTLVTTVMGVMKGCAFVRVHDIKENKRAIQMTEAILGR